MIFNEQDTYKEQKAQAEKTGSSTLETIKELSSEDDYVKGNLSLSKVLRGDVLKLPFLRRQIKLITLIVVFILIFISNRYSSEHEIQEIDRLQKELTDAKYKALASASALTEKCRESKVVQMLKETDDSLIHSSDQPPFIISRNE